MTDGRLLVAGALVATALVKRLLPTGSRAAGTGDRKAELVVVFVNLIALYRLLQTLHWQASGANSYSDHLLFERLYVDVEKEVDATAERLVGLFDGSAVAPAEIESKVTKRLGGWSTRGSAIEQALAAEQDVYVSIHRAVTAFASDPGAQNLLQGFADKHEEHLYLLRQRHSTKD